MPHTITITRGAAAPAMTRREVPSQAVFKLANGRHSYWAIGMNGRNYSVNLTTKQLSSTDNDDSKVVLLGRGEFVVNREFKLGQNRVGQEMLRRQVREGEVFRIKGGTDDYAHMGSVNKDRQGWLSVPLARQENHAVTSKGDSHVTVVGTFEIAVTLAA